MDLSLQEAQSTIGQRTWWQKFHDELIIQVRRNSVLMTLSLVFYFACLAVSWALDEPLHQNLVSYYKKITMYVVGLFCFFLVKEAIKLTFLEKHPDPVNQLLSNLKTVATDYRRYARMVPMLYGAALGFIAFLEIKNNIPRMVPFYFDDTLLQIERALHFGRLPIEWLGDLGRNPNLVLLVDQIYFLWYIPVTAIWAFAAVGNSDNGWERQYVLSFILCWLIAGTLLAIAMSSVGPCFYDLVATGSNPFEDQVAYLATFNQTEFILRAPYLQDFLRAAYVDPDVKFKSGISAMPSLHNAMMVLFTFAGYKINKWLGRIMAINIFVIYLGSILLAWHYAIDAYVGWAAALACWYLAGYLIKKQDKWLKLKTDNLQA